MDSTQKSKHFHELDSSSSRLQKQKTTLISNFKSSILNIIELKKTEVTDFSNQNLKGSNKNLLK